MGVNLFTLGEGEKVVSVDRVKEETDDDESIETEVISNISKNDENETID
jgi:hypothetical protein